MLSIVRRARWLLMSPYFGIQYVRALRARDRNDWKQLCAILERMHAKGLATGETRLYLAVGYLEMRRWGPALAQLESIEGRLGSDELEGHRQVNHAVALYMTNRFDEAAEILAGASRKGWSETSVRKCDAILSAIRDAG